MASGIMMKALCVAVACMVVAGPYAEAITCGQMVRSLMPCLSYLNGAGTGAVPATCCKGVKDTNAAVKSTADRQTACGCLKSAHKSNPGVNIDKAASLPGKCGVNVPFKISPNTDCSKVK